jgi:hypothetical protein
MLRGSLKRVSIKVFIRRYPKICADKAERENEIF